MPIDCVVLDWPDVLVDGDCRVSVLSVAENDKGSGEYVGDGCVSVHLYCRVDVICPAAESSGVPIVNVMSFVVVRTYIQWRVK